MDRRALLTGISLSLALPGIASARDFFAFLKALQARALAAGIPPAIVTQTTRHLVPNATVLKLDHHQAEFTETWAEYSSHVLSQTRIQAGAAKAAASRSLLAAVTSRFGVGAEPLLGIWGIETNYGASQGNFDVIDALTTLAWDRNSSFFGGQVIAAMRIVANGDAPAQRTEVEVNGLCSSGSIEPSLPVKTAVCPQMLLTDKTAEAIINSSTLVMV